MPYGEKIKCPKCEIIYFKDIGDCPNCEREAKFKADEIKTMAAVVKKIKPIKPIKPIEITKENLKKVSEGTFIGEKQV